MPFTFRVFNKTDQTLDLNPSHTSGEDGVMKVNDLFSDPNLVFDLKCNRNDKDGKTMFTNDIVKTTGEKPLFYQLMFSGENFFLFNPNLDDASKSFDLNYFSGKELEVVGNIHQDSQLLG